MNMKLMKPLEQLHLYFTAAQADAVLQVSFLYLDRMPVWPSLTSAGTVLTVKQTFLFSG